MKQKSHTCKTKDKDSIIQYWEIGGGYKEFEKKWVLDSWGIDGTRSLLVITNCPFCGTRLKRGNQNAISQ